MLWMTARHIMFGGRLGVAVYLLEYLPRYLGLILRNRGGNLYSGAEFLFISLQKSSERMVSICTPPLSIRLCCGGWFTVSLRWETCKQLSKTRPKKAAAEVKGNVPIYLSICLGTLPRQPLVIAVLAGAALYNFSATCRIVEAMAMLRVVLMLIPLDGFVSAPLLAHFSFRRLDSPRPPTFTSLSFDTGSESQIRKITYLAAVVPSPTIGSRRRQSVCRYGGPHQKFA